jgi:hypothetical protein
MATKVTQTSDESAGETSNGVKLLGEVIVPGASQFIDGNIRSGSLHLLGAVAAVTMLGGPGGLLISALVRGNSFTSSTLNKTLYRAIAGDSDKAAEPAPAGSGKLATT